MNNQSATLEQIRQAATHLPNPNAYPGAYYRVPLASSYGVHGDDYFRYADDSFKYLEFRNEMFYDAFARQAYHRWAFVGKTLC